MASLKNIVILGLIMISMIATESMLRTDDYDLAYLSDSEEVKATSELPAASTCGVDKTKASPVAADCQNDTANRCCLATVSDSAAGSTKPRTVCVLASANSATFADYLQSHTNAETDLKSAYAPLVTDTTVTYAFSCADKTSPAKATYTTCAAKDAPASLADCNTTANDSRCCFVEVTSGQDKGKYCWASTKSARTDANNFWTVSNADFAYTTKVTCGADLAPLTEGNCFDSAKGETAKTAPTAASDCTRALTGKCCYVPFSGTGAKTVCALAVGVNRGEAAQKGIDYFTNQFGANVDPNKVVCQAAGTPLENQCGLDKDKKALAAGVAPYATANCTSDKTDYCCKATGVAVGTTPAAVRCVKSGLVLKDVKDKNASRGNATGLVEDLFGDLSAVDCSSGFVKASVAIVAIVLALF